MSAQTLEDLVVAACDRGRRSPLDAPRSRKEIAATCGISRAYLYQLLTGSIANPRKHFIERLAKGLGVSAKKVRIAIELQRAAR